MASPHGAPPLLEARGLVKRYGDREVVAGLDLECRERSVLGLLGPNGAGKTTTVRMLYGFAPKDAGAIRYHGKDFDAHRTEVKRTIGVCTQDDSLDYDFSVRENLLVYAGYFRPKVEDLDRRVDELLELFGLAEYAEASPHALSGGYKRRLLIARSIVHRPKILFLDEPTTGLDPSARVDVWELVDRLRADGMGIVLTTHYMDEAERLSDSILVLSEGKAVARGDARHVIGSLLGEHVLVVPESMPERPALEAFVRDELAKQTHVVLRELQVPLTARELVLVEERFPGVPLRVRPPSLDDLFLRLARSKGGAG